MSIVTDGLRSDKWRAFAKQKLQMIKDLGLATKNYIISGYYISLYTLDGFDKARITAPPAIVITEIQYPDPATPGVGIQMLHYSEPFGASAYPAGPMGVAGDGILYPLLTSADAIHYDAPGYGVIFSSLSDFYHASIGFWAYLSALSQSVVGLGIHYANYAAKTLSPIGEIEGTGSTQSLVAWQTRIGKSIFTVDFSTGGFNQNSFRIFAFGINYRINIMFDMDSVEVQTVLGLMSAYPGVGRHLNARAVYIYPSPSAGLARIAVFASPSDSTDLLGGLYFFDISLNDKDAAHTTKWLGWSYVGRCLTGGLGGAWAVDSPLGPACGPVYYTGAQAYKSSVFPDGSGGVVSIIRLPVGDTGLLNGAYSFTPSGAARVGALAFPAEISDPQTWPIIFRGEAGAHLCLMEKIADSGPATNPICEVVAVHTGSPSAWTAIPAPQGTLLAVRPIHVSPQRTVLLALVWDGSGTFAAQYVSDGGGWLIMGKMSAHRMRRPVVGLFGNHEFSSLAQKFPGSFPVTSWAGTHTYTGG